MRPLCVSITSNVTQWKKLKRMSDSQHQGCYEKSAIDKVAYCQLTDNVMRKKSLAL